MLGVARRGGAAQLTRRPGAHPLRQSREEHLDLRLLQHKLDVTGCTAALVSADVRHRQAVVDHQPVQPTLEALPGVAWGGGTTGASEPRLLTRGCVGGLLRCHGRWAAGAGIGVGHEKGRAMGSNGTHLLLETL
eukprot:3021239-Prymnesium_polylepis.1